MSNNINNFGFNPVNFGNRPEKAKNEEEAPKCDCTECRECDTEAAKALDAINRTLVKSPYRFDPKKVEQDVQEFMYLYDEGLEEYIDECLVNNFAGNCYTELINQGVSPDRAGELAYTAANCFNPNL